MMSNGGRPSARIPHPEGVPGGGVKIRPATKDDGIIVDVPLLRLQAIGMAKTLMPASEWDEVLAVAAHVVAFLIEGKVPPVAQAVEAVPVWEAADPAYLDETVEATPVE